MKKMLVILLGITLVCSLLFACSGAPAATPDLNSGAPSQPVESRNTPAVTPPSPSAAVTQTPPPSPEPTSEAEKPFFMAKGYKVYYEVVLQNEYERVVGDLVQYVKSDGVDMQHNRVFYIRYTGAEENGQEVKMSSIWRDIPWSMLVFSVDSTDYRQPSILMNTGTQVYITYLFVPNNAPDDVSVSIRYAE